MQAGLPILAATDNNTDLGKIILKGQFGWWCNSNDINTFYKLINECINGDLDLKSKKSFEYLEKHYSIKKAYEIISKHFS